MTPNRYSDYGPKWTESIIDELQGVSFEVGIECDKKRRGSAVNVTVMDSDEERGLAVIQVRKSEFHPRRFTRVRKDYFLIGRNDNGNAFAHPVEVIATNANVKSALCKIWNTTPSVLDKLVRQGDVALIPERTVTFKDVSEFTVPEFTTGTHVIRAERVYVPLDAKDDRVFVAGSVSMTHERGQHPFISAKLPAHKLYRVQVGNRASTWGFARPTAD